MPEFSNIDSSLLFWILAFVSAFFIGFSKSGISGAGILAIPLMAYIFLPKQSTGILLPMLIAGDLIGVYFYRQHTQWKHIFRALPWAFAGIAAGWVFMKYSGISQEHFKKFIGVVVIGMLVGGEWFNRSNGEKSQKIPHTWWFAAIIGVLGGITTMTANAAGPVFAIYLLSLSLPKDNFIGTTAWIFLILNTSKVPFSWELGFITQETLIFNAEMIPALVLGSMVGVKTVKYIKNNTFSMLVKIFAVLAAGYLIFK
ncbi:MAG TPA: hypothetical protein DET40_17265 [Lentisphaeria bacterium]|nr:MAG: hypothetical protein A2X45_02740 [Lentisphaerae bacterium GWF2_50_93]HCE45292.1 hypothetical protein [Lentisphaeria bacterium]